MPEFERHQRINYLVILFLTFILLVLFQLNHLTLFFIIGYIIGTNWLTPDLDVNSKPSNHIIWSPYKKLSKHRGKTHMMIFGFIFPLLYITIIIVIIIGVIAFVVGYVVNDNELIIRFAEGSVELCTKYYKYILAFIGGICVSNTVHVIQDRVS